MPLRWALVNPPASLPLLRYENLGNSEFPPSTSCVGSRGNSSSWCIDTCLASGIANRVRQECESSCICHTWNRDYVDAILGSLGMLSLTCCSLVLIADLAGSTRRSRQAPTQSACLRWSNACNFFYSLYFVVFAGADFFQPLREPAGKGMCSAAWSGLIGRASCNTDRRSPFCFLNCCVFAVPWLQFFGYGSLLWNIMWLVDVVRFTYQPMRPEKIIGVPLIAVYHALTWICTSFIAFHNRLRTEQCREMSVVMLPCILRRANMKEGIPVFHIVGIVIGVTAIVIMGIRYVAAGAAIDSEHSSSRVVLAVRRYMRKQWRHTAILAAIWSLILADISAECVESTASYITATGFVGLGFFLSLDRLLVITKDTLNVARICQWLISYVSSFRHASSDFFCRIRGTSRTGDSISCIGQSVIDATPRNEEPLLTRAQSLKKDEGTREESWPPRGDSDDCYHLMDFESLLRHLGEYLREELATQTQLAALVDGLNNDARLAWLRGVAHLDDCADREADWCISPKAGADGSNTLFTVVAPRTFEYLRSLWGVDLEHFITEVQQTATSMQASSLKSAGKSGCSLLPAVDGRTFVLKTIHESEVKQLRALLPAYRQHLEDNPGSFLCRIYGCFTFRNSLGSRLHAVLMACLTAPPTEMHASLATGASLFSSIHSVIVEDCVQQRSPMEAPSHQIDIKSAFQDGGFGRIFPSGLVFVDGDDNSCVHSSSIAWEEVCGLTGLQADYAFLAQVGVVDYSLLLTFWESPATSLAASTSTGTKVAMEMGSARYFTVCCPRNRKANVNTVVRLGIIDFLQPFSTGKRAESALKRTLVHPLDGAAKVTIVDPQSYAARQLEFVRGKVFLHPEQRLEDFQPEVTGERSPERPTKKWNMFRRSLSTTCSNDSLHSLEALQINGMLSSTGSTRISSSAHCSVTSAAQNDELSVWCSDE